MTDRIEPPPAGEIQGLVEALRAKAKSASEVSWMLANAKTARNRAAEGEPNDGNGYQGLDPEQTIEWKAAEAITRLSQPSGEEIREAALDAIRREKDHWDDDVSALTALSDAAARIRAMPLPLSSGSNKSDDGKKGQTG